MTEPSADDTKIQKIRSELAGLDVDIKLLRLRLKAGFDPNQPRVPQGNPEGGRWTGDGSSVSGGSRNKIVDTQGSSAQNAGDNSFRTDGSLASQTVRDSDGGKIFSEFAPRGSISLWEERHQITLPSGSKFTFEYRGTTQTIIDGQGRVVSKVVWTPTGPETLPVVQSAAMSSAQTREILDAGRRLYNSLTTNNSSEQRACIAFVGREFRNRNTVAPELAFVGLLSRAEVDAACQRLDDVQRLTDIATKEAKAAGPYSSPAVFGTAVHVRLRDKILALRDSTLKLEVSLFKRVEEAFFSPSAIRVDVLEDRGTGTICVYDIKTGKRGLSLTRSIAFARRLPTGRPVIVIEVRPVE